MLNSLKRAYQYLILFGGFLKSPVLLLCRLYWGWLFFQGALEKLHNIHVFEEFLQGLNFPWPLFQAYLVALTEAIGGICLMLGLASRLVAIPLIIVMITAYSTAHVAAVKSIFIDPSTFVAQSPFNFLLTCLIVLAFGPGRFSFDYLLERWVFKKT